MVVRGQRCSHSNRDGLLSVNDGSVAFKGRFKDGIKPPEWLLQKEEIYGISEFVYCVC